MFSVYKITNLINQKKYIGSSIRVQKRWKQHINSSKNPNNPLYNYPLYQAFRKYGIENFEFSIISDDFDSIDEMENFEQEMILFYNSLTPNGYNQTLKTHSNSIATENAQKYIEKISCKCAKVDKNENIIEIYNSYHDAARKNGKDGDYSASVVRLVCKGQQSSCFDGLYFRDIDDNGQIVHQQIKNRHGKKPLIAINILEPTQEIYFESISSAARELGTDRTSIEKCIQGEKRYSIVKNHILREIDLNGNIIENNIDIQERIDEFNKRNPVINGERHSISEWGKIYNIEVGTINSRIRNGWDSVIAITTPAKRR